MYGNKNILQISYPIFLGLLAQNVINVTDTAFLGHVGEVELGASAIGGLYYICLYTLAFGFSIGAQILMARRNGEGNYTAIGSILNQGGLFSFLLALLLLGLSFLSARPVMRLMLSSDTILDASHTFFSVRVWGLLFSFISVMFRAFYVAITRTKVLTLNAIVMASINVVLDYAMIFGKWGFPRMGLEGAALASVIAEAGSLLFFLLYTRYAVDSKKYGLSIRLKINLSTIGNILSVSIFMMFQQFIPLATWFVFFLAIEHIGQRELAIANVVRSIYILVLIPVQALSTTTNTLVSNAMGAHRADDVMPIVRRIIKMCYTIVLPLIILLCLFPQWILLIYTNDSALIANCTASVYVMSAYYLLALPGNLLFQSVSGTGDTRMAFLIEMVTIVFYTLAIYVIIVRNRVDISFCWTVEYIYWGFKLMLSALFFKKANWRNKKI